MRATAWGVGAAWALDHAPGLIGAEDDVSAFVAHDDVMARLWKEHRSVRLTRALDVVRTLVAAILEQKVVGMEARRAWRRMTLALSEPAPGEGGLMLPPDPATVAEVPYYRFHPWGVERRRAEVIRAVCARAASARGARRRAVRRSAAPAGSDAGHRTVDRGGGDAPVVRRSGRRVRRRLPPARHRRMGPRARRTRHRRADAGAAGALPGQRGRVQVLLERSHIAPPAYGPRMEARSIEKL